MGVIVALTAVVVENSMGLTMPLRWLCLTTSLKPFTARHKAQGTRHKAQANRGAFASAELLKQEHVSLSLYG